MVTRELLKQYRYIVLEIADAETRIQRIEKRIEQLEQDGVVADKVSGGAGGKEHFTIRGVQSSKLTREENRLLHEKLRFVNTKNALEDIRDEIEEYIDAIPDAFTRMIFKYYFEDGMSQQEIADQLFIDQCNVSRKISDHLSQLA